VADELPEWAAETDADWRGTPLRAGALAVWVVGNHRAIEGEVVSWDRSFVTVRPLREARKVVGGVARAEDRHHRRPMSIERLKVTILDG
jgi:hypothetical protein